MDSIEAKNFIKDEIEARWPNWQPTQKEVYSWATILRKFPRTDATEAIEQTYIENQTTPKLKTFMSVARVKGQGTAHQPAGPSFSQTHFTPSCWIFNTRNGQMVETDSMCVESRLRKYNTRAIGNKTGDEWVAYRGATLNEMMALRHKISMERNKERRLEIKNTPESPTMAKPAFNPPTIPLDMAPFEPDAVADEIEAPSPWFTDEELETLNNEDELGEWNYD